MRTMILVVLMLVMGATAPGRVGAAPSASQFTVALSIAPQSIPNDTLPTLQVHTRIGAVCTPTIAYLGSETPALYLATQHVGQTGIVRWTWQVETTATNGEAAVACTAKHQTVIGRVRFTVVNPIPTPTPEPTAIPFVSPTYRQVNDHPDVYQGQTVVWNCAIAKFLGADSDNASNTIIGCFEFTGTYQGDTGDGEIALSVPPSIDTSSMATDDAVTLLGTVGIPLQGTNGYGAAITLPRIMVTELKDDGPANHP